MNRFTLLCLAAITTLFATNAFAERIHDSLSCPDLTGQYVDDTTPEVLPLFLEAISGMDNGEHSLTLITEDEEDVYLVLDGIAKEDHEERITYRALCENQNVVLEEMYDGSIFRTSSIYLNDDLDLVMTVDDPDTEAVTTVLRRL